jgi:hypothetical protein
MSVVEKIVTNIKNNFSTLIKPETWNKFFSHASDLAEKFGVFFSNIFRDVFAFAVDFFKWSFENMNLFKLLWSPANMFMEGLTGFLKEIGATLPFDEIDAFLKEANQAAQKAMGGTSPAYNAATRPNAQMGPIPPPSTEPTPVSFDNFPGFNLSEDTKKAFSDLSSELKKTFTVALDTLADTDVSTEYKKTYDEALAKIEETIRRMEEPPAEPDPKPIDLNKIIKEYQKTLNANLSPANKGFSDANSSINNILGSATGEAADAIREKMKALNERFQESTKTIDGLFDTLKDAKSAEEVESAFKAINSEIGNINNLAGSMNSLKSAAGKAKTSFDLLQGVLSSIGELGAVIEAAMSSNWIGVIIMLIGKLASAFSSLSSNAAAAQNILTFFVDTIAEVMQNMGPALDAIFKPFLDIFAALGRVIGSLLNIVLPIVGIITQFTSLLNIFVPILNAIALGFAFVADCVAKFWNVIVDLVEKITFSFVKLGKMDANNFDRMMESITMEQDYGKYQNNSTSYTVAGDMYININFSQSYVNGDARQIAIMLRDEIRSAEKAGY